MTRVIQWLLMLAVTLLVSVGCSTSEVQVVSDISLEIKKADPNAFPFNLEAATLLASADALDGAEDQVVGKCGGCALTMDGSAEHALKVGDYQMHFCSDYCRNGFEKDTEKALMALTIPD